jgi:hypothetical protein
MDATPIMQSSRSSRRSGDQTAPGSVPPLLPAGQELLLVLTTGRILAIILSVEILCVAHGGFIAPLPVLLLADFLPLFVPRAVGRAQARLRLCGVEREEHRKTKCEEEKGKPEGSCRFHLSAY